MGLCGPSFTGPQEGDKPSRSHNSMLSLGRFSWTLSTGVSALAKVSVGQQCHPTSRIYVSLAYRHFGGNQVNKDLIHKSNLARHLLPYDLSPKNSSYIFKGLKTIRRRIIFYDRLKLYEIQISVSKFICLLVIYGYFQATMAEFSCERDPFNLQSLKYLLLDPSQKRLTGLWCSLMTQDASGPWCSAMTWDVSWVFCFTSWLLIISSRSRDGNGRWEKKRILLISEIKFLASWMEWGPCVIPTLILHKQSNVLSSCTFRSVLQIHSCHALPYRLSVWASWLFFWSCFESNTQRSPPSLGIRILQLSPNLNVRPPLQPWKSVFVLSTCKSSQQDFSEQSCFQISWMVFLSRLNHFFQFKNLRCDFFFIL